MTPLATRRSLQKERRNVARRGSELEELGFEDVDEEDDVDAQLEAQFISEMRSQGGGSLARGILSDPDIEGNPLSFLKVSEAYWTAMRTQLPKRGPTVVRVRHRRMPAPPEYDVCVCGGTLGIFIGLALQLRGFRVCIVEKRRVEGRNQEWNIARDELEVLVDMGLLFEDELQRAIASEFNPVRISFKGGSDIWVRDVLNLGVSPRVLLDILKARFLEVGGTVMEDRAFSAAEVYNDGVLVKLTAGTAAAPMNVGDANRPLAASQARPAQAGARPEEEAEDDEEAEETPVRGRPSQTRSRGAAAPSKAKGGEVRARLLLDAMGHWSSIVKQMRGVQRPDGMLLVVGTCASGVPPALNQSGDFLRTITDSREDMQLYWEAFPAEGGSARTTYCFTYADTDRRRPSLTELLDRYFELLPEYTGVPLSALKIKRALFGGFPCYADGPLRTQFDRVLQIGDASSAQSPLSFGGFVSLLRHLPRLTEGVSAALEQDKLSQGNLAALQPYQPSLSASWLFQRSMSLPIGQLREARGRKPQTSGFLPPSHINRLLRANFAVMRLLGDKVLRPFMKDTILWGPLTATMVGVMLSAPLAVARVLVQVGPQVVLGWVKHYACLSLYAALYFITKPLRRFKSLYRLQRWLDALQWGSGHDYNYKPPTSAGEGLEGGYASKNGTGMNGSGVDKALEAAGGVLNSVDEELSGSGGSGETPIVPAAA